MKKIFFLLATVTLFSCGHDHSKDKVIGNVHELYLKEVNRMKKDMHNEMVLTKKKIVDSMKVYLKNSAETAPGWYSSKDMKLPTGTIIDFNPTSLTANSGPYYIIIRGFDGKQSINNVDREKWLLLQRGDILK